MYCSYLRRFCTKPIKNIHRAPSGHANEACPFLSSLRTVVVMEESDRLKAEGNEHFKAGRNVAANECYTAALEHHRSAALLCNRAFALLRLELPGGALKDAEEAIELDPNFIKAYYRKASAHLQMGKFKEALADFKQVVRIVPDDADANAKLQFCEKEVKKIMFLKAIASGESAPMSERTDLSKITIPSTYKGPVMENDTVTADFVMTMVKEFEAERLISRRDIISMLLKAIAYFREQPNVVSIPLPGDGLITVCGDTHGQFYDLLNIFKINGYPSPENRYLFNGDFVDRGSYSFETVTTLMAFKLLYPDAVFLSRGNHETVGMNKMYGFEGEVKHKYDETVLQLFQEMFQTLPLGHIIQDQVFVTHGGLFTKDGVTIDDIQKVHRFREPDEGLMCEMLWSDPRPMSGRAPSMRGVGVAFGPDVTDDFLKTNKLSLVVRSHEVKDEGYLEMHDGKCITIFSAPNYCDQVGNKGAFIHFRGNNMKPKFTTFTHVPHPGKKPMQYSAAMGGMMGM